MVLSLAMVVYLSYFMLVIVLAFICPDLQAMGSLLGLFTLANVLYVGYCAGAAAAAPVDMCFLWVGGDRADEPPQRFRRRWAPNQ